MSLLSKHLRRRLRPTPDHPLGQRKAQVIAIAASKGGVGKTTSAVNLACALALQPDHQVLLADLDPQGHVASALRATQPTGDVRLSDILLATRARDLMDAVLPSGIENLHLMPLDKQLGETEAQLTSRVGRESILKAAMCTARTQFDTILLDCPPMLGNLTLNALVAADAVLIPCDMSILALEGVADLLELVETVRVRLGHPIKILGILRTRFDARTVQINRVVGEALRENFGDMLLDTVIPINSTLAQAQTVGQSIFTFQPNARGAKAYRSLAEEVLQKRKQ